jgi:hypothetical protein
MAVKKTKSKKKNIDIYRENSKRDMSPKWEGHEAWTDEKFVQHFREAMTYYNLNSNPKDLKIKVLAWMSTAGYKPAVITKFKNTNDWRCGITMGAIAACLLKGMPESRKGFNHGRSNADWLRNRIESVIVAGQRDKVADETGKTANGPVITIQDRLREQAIEMSAEIDSAVEGFNEDPDNFDPKSFKMIALLRGKAAKAVHARMIKGFFQSELAELLEAVAADADEQLKEAYAHHTKKNVKKLIEFYQSLQSACEQIAAEAKVLKKPRTKKIKPAEDIVKKLKFKISDDKLGITSVPATSIIGSQLAVIYNTKSRKIGLYVAKTSNGLGVKGTSVIDFTEKSFQKTLRKPETQLRDFKEQNTQKRVEMWFDKIKATETKLNGRINSEIIILKTFR